ncbi:MAG TPA: hypothetical protein VIK59_06290 [Verrucomicrobiae bacterium]
MTNEFPSDVKRFSVSIISLFLFIFVGGCSISVIVGFLLFGHNDLPRYFRAIKSGMPFLLLLAVIITSLLYVITKPVGFSSDGIYASSSWGFRRFVRWSDIAKVRKHRLLNLKFLRIYSSGDGKVTTLRLFQARKKEFRDEIRKFAPPDSLVLNFLNWF